MEKSKNLIVSILLAVFFNLLIKPAWVFTENGVQAHMGNDYGLYAALLSLAALWNISSDLGLNQWITRTFANHPEKYTSDLPQILGAKLWLSLLYLPSLMVLGAFLGYTLQELYLLLILGFYQISLSWTQLFRANIQAFQHFRWDSFIGIIDKLFLLSFVIIFPSYASHIQGFTLLTLLSGILAMLSGYFANRRLIGKFVFHLNGKHLWTLLKRSIPFAVMALLFTANERLNQVMLERMLGKEESSVYAAAFRWTSAISMFLWVILPIFYAKFAKINTENTENLKKIFLLGWTLVALPTLFITGWVVFYGQTLLFQFSHLSDTKQQYIFQVLQILIFTVFLNGCFNIFSTYLTATHREKQINIVLSISVLLNIILNFIFIPIWGAWGTALATVFAFICQSIGFVYFFHRYAPINVPYANLFRFLCVALGFGLTLYVCHTKVHFFWGACISGLILLLLSFMLGVVRISMIKTDFHIN